MLRICFYTHTHDCNILASSKLLCWQLSKLWSFFGFLTWYGTYYLGNPKGGLNLTTAHVGIVGIVYASPDALKAGFRVLELWD